MKLAHVEWPVSARAPPFVGPARCGALGLVDEPVTCPLCIAVCSAGPLTRLPDDEFYRLVVRADALRDRGCTAWFRPKGWKT